MVTPSLPDNLGYIRALAEAALAPAVRIRVGPASPQLAPAASRFGGHPFAPPGFSWPGSASGRPMEFIGQLNVAEVPAQPEPGLLQVPLDLPGLAPQAVSGPLQLPREGLLQFFYDLEEGAGLYSEARPDFWRFIWYPAVLETPDWQMAEGPAFPEIAHPITFQTGYFSLPDLWTLLDQDDGPILDPLVRAAHDAYVRVQDLLARDDRPRHQLLGHPVAIQYDPRWDLMRALGLGGMRAAELRRHQFGDWQLLWQIDSDDNLKYMWGDAGMLYVYVRRSALAQGNLSAAWLTAQCT